MAANYQLVFWDVILELMPLLKGILCSLGSRCEFRREKLDVDVGSGKDPTSNFNNPASNFQHPTSCEGRNWKFQRAYTLIELMIVVTLIGLAVGLITTSYLGFERRQRVKNTALEIKNNIRLAQNSAHSGDKGFGPTKCDTEKREILVGWYVRLDKDLQTYSVSGYCKDESGVERKFGEQTFRLPQDVSISEIDAGNQVNVLYRPLSENATFHSSSDFLDNNGKLQNLISAGQVTIDLAGPTPYKYQLIILPTGEINEKQL